jgi:hypothetical protein
VYIELAAPNGVWVKIRPETGEGEAVPDFVGCPPTCRLSIFPGRYRIEGEPPLASDLRRVASTVEITSDARIEVMPGSRSDHAWGFGLTIGGAILLGLGMVFAFSQEAGADPSDTGTRAVALTMIGVGAPLTGVGIYLFVHGKNRVDVDGTWQGSPAPVQRPAETHVEVGGRF